MVNKISGCVRGCEQRWPAEKKHKDNAGQQA
jgi:hypothetical protein